MEETDDSEGKRNVFIYFDDIVVIGCGFVEKYEFQ